MLKSLTPYRRNGLSKNYSLFDDFDSLFLDFIPAFYSSLNDNRYNNENYKSETIKEDENSYKLEIGMPGLTSKDVDIELRGDYLIISYSKNDFKYLMPKNIDRNNVDAFVKNGLLEVSIPKIMDEKKKPIKVEVK